MSVPGSYAEKISRQGKFGDVATPVAENLEGTNRALDYFIKMVGRLASAKELDIFRITFRFGCKRLDPIRYLPSLIDRSGGSFICACCGISGAGSLGRLTWTPILGQPHPSTFNVKSVRCCWTYIKPRVLTRSLIGVEPDSLQQHGMLAPVRFGSKADIHGPQCDVRFTPESGHRAAGLRCRLSAISGHRAGSSLDHFVGAQEE